MKTTSQLAQAIRRVSDEGNLIRGAYYSHNHQKTCLITSCYPGIKHVQDVPSDEIGSSLWRLIVDMYDTLPDHKYDEYTKRFITALENAGPGWREAFMATVPVSGLDAVDWINEHCKTETWLRLCTILEESASHAHYIPAGQVS